MVIGLLLWLANTALAELRVGAAKVDVTPDQLPVLINGGMTSHSADKVKTRVNARAIVMDDGSERLAVMVVDSCMMPRTLLDEAKQLAATRTGLRPERILISATHSHSVPSSCGALGTDADANYVPLLRQRLVEALVAAERNLAPARVGWGEGQAAQFTALRRWVRRPDRIDLDPFGNPTVRANMHSAVDPLQAIGPTGPEDPQLTMIAFETLQGKPIATLANFSMHYFSDSPISADYFGLFCDGLEKHLHGQRANGDKGTDAAGEAAKTNGNNNADPVPVAIMSHGCSGDIWKKDYLHPQAAADGTIEEFTQGLLNIAQGVYDNIETVADADLAMQEALLPMRYRTPDAQRLQWAEQIVSELGERLPQTLTEIYAREQVFLHRMQATELVLQAIRIGDIAIVSTPCETYALTGLKLKLQSPTTKTMVIELANGAEGYIPPPEQHVLGGYNTWAARSAGLETTAEPKIVATNLALLEQVFQQPRREFQQSRGPASAAIAELQPLAYWRLDELSGPVAEDASGAGRSATYEAGVLFFLEGPTATGELAAAEPAARGTWKSFTSNDDVNRCAHFAGGRLAAQLPALPEDFSVVLTFWNGMPGGVRPVAGWMLSRDYEFATSQRGLHVGLSGDAASEGRLLLQVGTMEPLLGSAVTPRWEWGKAVLVKGEDKLAVYQSNADKAEMETVLPEEWESGPELTEWFFGGRSDGRDNWEGKLDEIAVFDFALNKEQIGSLLE